MYSTFEHARVQKVFFMAHKLSHDATIGDRERKYFRAIAYELWKASGEHDQPIPEVLPPSGNVLAHAAMAEVESE